MESTHSLYEQLLARDGVPRGLPMVAALTGFMDTGNAVEQFTEQLRDHLELQPLLQFDIDEFYDYRGRRPIISFDQDHLTDYHAPYIDVSLATDDAGAKFLFLHGVEPDFRWNGFADVIEELIADCAVSSFTWVHSIPMPAPHTRPIQVTVSGNRSDLIERYSIWRPRTQVPSNVLHLLEYRLAQHELECAGFVLLVPHYLGDNSYPDAALKALECVGAATGLLLPSDALREEGRVFARQLAEQMTQNEELQSMIHGLEVRHDSFLGGADVQLPNGDSFDVPDAESLAAEWEQFLANRPQGDGAAQSE